MKELIKIRSDEKNTHKDFDDNILKKRERKKERKFVIEVMMQKEKKKERKKVSYWGDGTQRNK